MTFWSMQIDTLNFFQKNSSLFEHDDIFFSARYSSPNEISSQFNNFPNEIISAFDLKVLCYLQSEKI